MTFVPARPVQKHLQKRWREKEQWWKGLLEPRISKYRSTNIPGSQSWPQPIQFHFKSLNGIKLDLVTFCGVHVDKMTQANPMFTIITGKKQRI